MKLLSCTFVFLISYFADVDLSDRFRKGSSSLTMCIKDEIELLLPFSFMLVLALGYITSRHENCTATDTFSQNKLAACDYKSIQHHLKVIMYPDSNAHSRPTTTVKCDILNLLLGMLVIVSFSSGVRVNQRAIVEKVYFGGTFF